MGGGVHPNPKPQKHLSLRPCKVMMIDVPGGVSSFTVSAENGLGICDGTIFIQSEMLRLFQCLTTPWECTALLALLCKAAGTVPTPVPLEETLMITMPTEQDGTLHCPSNRVLCQSLGDSAPVCRDGIKDEVVAGASAPACCMQIQHILSARPKEQNPLVLGIEYRVRS